MCSGWHWGSLTRKYVRAVERDLRIGVTQSQSQVRAPHTSRGLRCGAVRCVASGAFNFNFNFRMFW